MNQDESWALDIFSKEVGNYGQSSDPSTVINYADKYLLIILLAVLIVLNYIGLSRLSIN